MNENQEKIAPRRSLFPKYTIDIDGSMKNQEKMGEKRSKMYTCLDIQQRKYKLAWPYFSSTTK
jgi:hypothetical protein